jgi:hypothetical protein
MMAQHWVRLSKPALALVAGAFFGLIGGTATVHGMDDSRYGVGARQQVMDKSIWASKDSGSYDDGSSYTEPSGLQPASFASDCDGCSERDLGYRWAGLQGISSASDCPADSWDFQRGCVDYMRDVHGA